MDCEKSTLEDLSISAAVIRLDIDKFKTINDKHRQECGDTVLRHFAVVVRSTLTIRTFFVRLGGEES